MTYDVNKLSPLKTAMIASHLRGTYVLDLGAGQGDHTKWLLSKFPTVSATAVDQLDLSADGFSYIKLDLEAQKMPFQNEAFDTILAFDIIEHLADPHPFLDELSRVCKKGGIVLGSTGNDDDKFLPDYNLTFYHRSDLTHKKYYDAKSLQEILMLHGFTQVQVTEEGGINPYLLTEFAVPWLKWPLQKTISLLIRLKLLRMDKLYSDLSFIAYKN